MFSRWAASQRFPSVTLRVSPRLEPPRTFAGLLHRRSQHIHRASYAWYLSILLWIASAVYYDIVALMLFRGMNPVLMMATLSLATFVTAVFIVYFQSEQVKTYFLEPSN